MAAVDGHEERERLRQGEVDRLELDRFAEVAYDDLVRLAADIMKTPVALISLVDGDKQWFKARIGLDAAETSREFAFCAHAIQNPDEVMVVADARLDPRFATNPLVTGEPAIRFYAGAPLVTTSGHAVGTLCVIDTEARTIGDDQLRELRFLAQQVITTMERHRGSIDTPPSAKS